MEYKGVIVSIIWYNGIYVYSSMEYEEVIVSSTVVSDN